MKIELFHWLEGPEELELGPYAGALWIEPDCVEVDVVDEQLEERLLHLLDTPLSILGSSASGGTARRVVEPGEKDYFQALVERLARRDYRLHAAEAEES